MTARFQMTRTSDTAERIISRFLGGADIAFASRREPFGRDPALSAAGEPSHDDLNTGLIGGAEIHSCHVCAESWHGGFVSGPCGWSGCPFAEQAEFSSEHGGVNG